MKGDINEGLKRSIDKAMEMEGDTEYPVSLKSVGTRLKMHLRLTQ